MLSSSLAELSSTRHLPIIQRPIDNTALTDYMTCPRKYLYGMVLNRRGSGEHTTAALNYGTAWHKALETHYRYAQDQDNFSLRELVELAVMKVWKDCGDPEDFRTLDRLMIEYDKYVKHYGLPHEEEAKTVGWPKQPLLEISTELTWPGAAHPYTGKIDRIIEHHGQLFVEDYKTASRLESNYFLQWALSNQMTGYAYMAGLVAGKQISGVRINLHVIRTKDSVFERQTLLFNKERLAHWAENYNTWIRRMEQDYIRWENGETEAFPHNFSACSGKYSMCPYTAVCGTVPRLRMAALEQDFEVNPWNPLEAEDE